MSKSKLIETNEKIAESVTSSFQKVENSVVGTYQKVEGCVVGAYKKVENSFVGKFLTCEGESTEEAKKRLAEEQAAWKEADNRSYGKVL